MPTHTVLTPAPSALRQPIVCVLGHVDHGKTSLLDAIRSTNITSKEVGGITQKISAWEVPKSTIDKVCAPVLSRMGIKLKIPGVLFVDTPGHADFTNLRKRGGNLADIAILVIDVTKGVEPQTIEALEILREYKTPFVVALNKVDAISGWRPSPESQKSTRTYVPFLDALHAQREDVQLALDTKLYELVGKLYQYSFQADRADRVTDLAKSILIVPCSAKTREGLPDLLMYVAGLAQKFLEENLKSHVDAPGKAAVLEVREEKGFGKVVDVVLYDGTMKVGDTAVFSTLDGLAASPIRTLVRGKPVESASAAASVVVICDMADKAIAGSSFLIGRNEEEVDAAAAEVEAEVKELTFESQKTGVILKADALGSLEAIAKLFAREGIPIRSANIGKVSRRDAIQAIAVREKDVFSGVVFAFNVPVDEEARALMDENKVRLFEEKIIYNLVHGYKEWKDETVAMERKNAFANIQLPAQIQILHGFTFRASNPAVVGIEVQIGTLKKGSELMKEDGEVVCAAKELQKEKKGVDQAKKGEQVAASFPGITMGRQLKEKDILLTALRESDCKALINKYSTSLTPEERDLLRKIIQLRGFKILGA